MTPQEAIKLMLDAAEDTLGHPSAKEFSAAAEAVTALQAELAEAKKQAAEAAALAELLRKQLQRNLQGYNNLLEFYCRDGYITVAEDLVGDVATEIQAILDVEPTDAALAWHRNQVLEATARQGDANATKASEAYFSAPNALEQAQDRWEESEFWRMFARMVRSFKGPQ